MFERSVMLPVVQQKMLQNHMPALLIREEQPDDVEAIRVVNRQAFETHVEADLVDRLRETCAERLSLVALRSDAVVGHILFTPALAQAGERSIKGMGLAPMAVLPNYQRQGIGTALVRRGLDMVREAGYPFVIVLGHPSYYPRFGFERAAAYGLHCEYQGVPEEAFMIRVLQPAVAEQMSGEVTYRPEFAAAL